MSGSASRRAGSRARSAQATLTSRWPLSNPKLPASPQQPRFERLGLGAGRRRAARWSASQPRTACWWQCTWATSAWSRRAGGGFQPGVCSVSSSARVTVCRVRRRDVEVVGEQVRRVGAEDRRAAGFEADDEAARRGRGRRARRRCVRRTRLAVVELAGGDPGQPAAQRLGGDGHATSRRLRAPRRRRGRRGGGSGW